MWKIICVIVTLGWLNSSALAQPATEEEEGSSKKTATALAQEATEKLRAGSLDAAIEKFDQSISTAPPSSILLYNKAIAHTRKGESDLARQLFAQAAEDPKLAAKARYNMGNADYGDAVKLLQGDEGQESTVEDAEAAIAKLKAAITHYKRSLAVDRSDADARANIESAHRLIKKIEEQLPQQEQQQQNDQQQNQQQHPQEQSGSQDQDQQSQDQESDQNPNDSEQSEQPSDSSQQEPQSDDSQEDSEQEQEPNQQESEQQQQESEQQQEQQGQEQEDQQPQQSSDETSGEDQQSRRPESADKQEASEDKSDSEQTDDPRQTSDDPQPKGELKAQNETSDSEPPPPEAFQEGQKMTMEEARKMLQAVRDRDFRRRLEKLRQMRTRRVRVEKDW